MGVRDWRSAGTGPGAAAILLAAAFVGGCGGSPASGPTVGPSQAAVLTPAPISASTAPPTAHPSVAPTPHGTPAPTSSSTATPPALPTPSSASSGLARLACPAPSTHLVAAGETLSGIAQDHGVDVQALLAVNPQITDPRLIHTGERLVISPIDLATIGGRDFSPVAMNDRGQIVGRRDTADGTSHAALLEDGVLTDLATSAQDFTPVAINDRGQVVGMTGTDPTKAHAAIWEDGALTDLGTLGGGASEAIDINDRGQVIGMSETAAGGQTHPFLWQGGRMTDLGTSPGLAGRDVYPMALGDRGEVVVVTADYPWHVLVWRDGAVTDLGLEEQSEGWVFDINDRGQVVGNPGGPALWTDGRDERLPGLPVPPDAPDRWTAVEALNNAGQAVGWSGTGVLARSPLVHGYDSTLHRAVLWTEGRVVDLGTLRTTDSEAYAINDCGMVLGESFDRGPAGYEAGHPVLWYVPTPERAVSQ